MFIRPVTMNDHDAVLELARQAGIGMTSLPPDPDVLLSKILQSVKSFGGKPDAPQQERFFFVVENPANGDIVGTCGIVSHVGMRQPFYSYRIMTITQVSQSINLFSRHQMLHVTNDLTGSSEIGSLFLRPDCRRDGLGRLVSLTRFLFMAEFPELFAEQVIAEMRGVNHGNGDAPFYNSIARPFFEMDFAKADYTNATLGSQFITDLLPRNPIYVSLLPEEARAVIGVPHPQSAPAKTMLEREGFVWRNYIDVFDGGPTLQVDREQIRTIRTSVAAEVANIESLPEGQGTAHLFCNSRFNEFRSCAGRAVSKGDTILLAPEVAEKLQVEKGDRIRYLAS